MRLFWYLQKKPVRVCIRSLYREYPPLKLRYKTRKSCFEGFPPQSLWQFQGGLPPTKCKTLPKLQPSPVGKLPGLLPRTSQTALLLVSSVDVALENATEILGFGIGWET